MINNTQYDCLLELVKKRRTIRQFQCETEGALIISENRARFSYLLELLDAR